LLFSKLQAFYVLRFDIFSYPVGGVNVGAMKYL